MTPTMDEATRKGSIPMSSRRVIAPEGHARFRVQRHLGDPRNLILYRVFDRDDIDLGPVQPVEDGVEGCRLAAARGAGEEDDPVGPGGNRLEALVIFGRQAESLEADEGTAPVQDPHDHLLPPDDGDCGHAEVDAPALDS